jgi:carboxymethylenebutenolidase
MSISTRDGDDFSGYLALPEGGSGPGIVVAQEIFGVNKVMRLVAERFAEEGYVVLVPDLFWRLEPNIDLGYSEEDWQRAIKLMQAFDVDMGIEDMGAALDALGALPECTDGPAVIGYCLGGKLAYLTACRHSPNAAVAYYGVGIEEHLDESGGISCPTVLHIAGQDAYVSAEAIAAIEGHFEGHAQVNTFVYPEADHAFAREGEEHYHRPSALVAHSRTLACFKGVMGPHFDLEAIWDQHTKLEFVDHDAAETMKTMVAEPYVNHIPTMTGGVGKELLHRFYKYHFIPTLPEDTALASISRTVGVDRVVDEMIFSFTHTKEIDWMLPGVAPTGKRVEIPLVVIACVRGGKLYHEHIYWDQASVLVQIGLLDPEGLPVAGIETANKVVDKTLPSNELMIGWAESKGKPL